MKHAPDLMADHQRAADWHVRRGGADWTGEDEQALQAWRDADPQHDQLYRRLEQTWLDVRQVPRPSLAGEAAAKEVPVSRSKPQRARAGLMQRFGLQWRPLAMAACLTLAVGGWLAYDNIPHYRLEAATADGTRMLSLPDGSQLALNRHSAVSVRLYARRREVSLKEGEAFFEVSHHPDRPFTVLAAGGEVRVVGTVFDVRADARQLVVQVREGRVEVRPDARVRERFTTLTANEGLRIDEQAEGGRRFSVTPDMVGDWRSGQLVFRATSLASVAETLARYLGRPVRLADPALGELAVSGYVAMAAPQAFLESLPDLLPVKVRRDGDGAYLITRR